MTAGDFIVSLYHISTKVIDWSQRVSSARWCSPTKVSTRMSWISCLASSSRSSPRIWRIPAGGREASTERSASSQTTLSRLSPLNRFQRSLGQLRRNMSSKKSWTLGLFLSAHCYLLTPSSSTVVRFVVISRTQQKISERQMVWWALQTQN